MLGGIVTPDGGIKMLTQDLLSTSRDWLSSGNSAFFLRSPFRWPYFLATSIFLFMDVVLCAFVLAERGNRVGSLGICCLIGSITALVVFWLLTLRIHSSVNKFFTTAQTEAVKEASPLSVALGATVVLSNGGLWLASVAVAGCLLALLETLR